MTRTTLITNKNLIKETVKIVKAYVEDFKDEYKETYEEVRVFIEQHRNKFN